MENHHEGQGCRYRGIGYAPTGHPAGQKSDGDVPDRHHFAGVVLCGGKRARQHPPVAERENCGGESAGRGGGGGGVGVWPPPPPPRRRAFAAPTSKECRMPLSAFWDRAAVYKKAIPLLARYLR